MENDDRTPSPNIKIINRRIRSFNKSISRSGIPFDSLIEIDLYIISSYPIAATDPNKIATIRIYSFGTKNGIAPTIAPIIYPTISILTTFLKISLVTFGFFSATIYHRIINIILERNNPMLITRIPSGLEISSTLAIINSGSIVLISPIRIRYDAL